MTESNRICRELETAEMRDREYLPRQTKSALGEYVPYVPEPENAERAELVLDDYKLRDLLYLIIRWEQGGKLTGRMKAIKELLNAERLKVVGKIGAIDATKA